MTDTDGTALPPAHEQPDPTCPRCSSPIHAVPGYPRWCPACDWNINAGRDLPRDERSDRQRARDQKRADLLATSLDGGGPDPSRAERRLALLVACALHAVTLVLAGSGVAVLVATFPAVPGLVLAALLLGMAYGLRPRIGRLSKVKHGRSRLELPATFALLDQISTLLDAPQVQRVQLVDGYNAATHVVGWRRRTVVLIGAPLWVALTPQQRVAVLAHEIGHSVNGDTRRTLVTGTALDTLHGWHQLMDPRQYMRLSQGSRRLGGGLILPLTRGLAAVTRGVYGLLDRLTIRSGTRAEYLADELSARVAGTDAAAAALDELALAPTAATSYRTAVQRGVDDPWAVEASVLAALPESERARLRRLGDVAGDRIDSSHPRTARRLDALRRTNFPPQLTLDEVTAAAIDAELRPDFDRLAEASRKRLVGA